MKNNSKWKKICSTALAVCLIGTLLVSNQSFGVFAEEESQKVTQEEEQPESITEETSQDADDFVNLEMTENNSEDRLNETENDNADSETTPEDEFYTEENPGTDVALSQEAESEEETDGEDISVFSDSGEENTWQCQKDNVTVTGNGTTVQSISVESGTNENLYTGDKIVAFDYNITSESETSGELTFTISDIGIMSDDESLEIWHVQSGNLKQVTNVIRNEGSVTFTTTEIGEYIAVSNVCTVDLAKGNVSFTKDAFNGIRQDGVKVSHSFTDDTQYKYRISQSNNSNRVQNNIVSNTKESYTSNKTLILDGINTSNSLDIPAYEHTVLLTLQLRNENQIHHIYYGTGRHGNQTDENKNNDNSQLKIENYGNNGCGTDGKLYIPYKMSNQTEELQYVLTRIDGGNIGSYWSRAGIGGGPSGDFNNSTGLIIAGGTLRVLGKNANGATAIGGGGNGDGKISITGGNITAISSCTGAAIGGGIGWIFRGGYADVSITGGTVYAENLNYYTRDNKVLYGGVAIGSGSSMEWSGSAAKIHIGGTSNVTAYARYGNGIGSGNSYEGTAAEADIAIDGSGTVTTNALGGGTSKSGQGGSANISIGENAQVNCVKYSDIQEKWDPEKENILGAFGIGGGNSAGDAKGGNAVVNVSGGFLNCNGGNIGGGDAVETGDGGDASIYVSGGTLDCGSIGGGNSTTGTPGSVTSDSQAAGVVVTGGTLKAGTIGGGTNANGAVGFATAEISGGTIQGQFILANTDTSKQCFFHMTGGTINNASLGSGKYLKAQENGGAVCLSDPKGEVTISGGIIKQSNAARGGAVYMTAGTVTLSGDAVIQNCQALGNSEKNIKAQGGAIYLDNGTVNISNGKLLANKATDGAGVYMNGGSLNVSGGTIAQNESTEIGGGAYVQSGTITMTGGTIGEENASNKAAKGAGVYIAGGTLNVNGGTIQKNEATEAGGGAYLASGDLNISAGSIAENTAPDGAGAYLAGGNLTINENGTFSKNTATQNGGAAYLANGTLTLNGGTVSSNTAVQNGGGFYAADGAVRMFGGSIKENKATEAGGGLFVSSDTSAADVVIRSGSITGNTAGTSGGGIAVASSNRNAQADKVIVGLSAEHIGLAVNEDDPAKRTFTAFHYMDEKDSKEHIHETCPVLKDNKASNKGGGIYMESANAELDIYCLIESGNSSVANTAGNGAMMAGGTVTIGDENHETDETYGNVVISSSILVEGGTVNIWGNMKNPLFKNNILVDIQGSTEGSNGSFEDHRSQASKEVNYKIHYFENFVEEGATKPTGRYTAKQYASDVDISPEGALFSHEGWKIVGWATEADKNSGKTTYNIGGELIGSKDNHTAWGEDNTQALVLYAIWQQITYTVKFDANAGTEQYTGNMSNQGFTYGISQKLNENQYKIKGKKFNGWNTGKDGKGTPYAADYSDSKMTTADDNPTITLYAKWEDCTHDGKQYAKRSSDTNTIEINCDCGYQATVTLSAVTSYYNGNPHPASLNIGGDSSLLEQTPTIQYSKKQDDETYGSMPEGENVPTNVGEYRASITLGSETISVDYEIKSATAGIDIEARTVAGQYFKDFNGSETANISQDDACTVQFDVFNLNTEIYTTEPKLSFGGNLPVGTTIIMQTGNQYAYLKIDSIKSELNLTDFTLMGESGKFVYTANDTQTYRFVVDFSQAEQLLETKIKISLAYEPSGEATEKLKKEVTLECVKKADFSLSFANDTNTLSITAPDKTENNRWNNMEQVLVLQGDNTIPSDAKLTVTNGGTTEVTLNTAKQFVVPIAWEANQNIQLSLTTDQLAKAENYKFTVSLYTGASDGQTLIKAKSLDAKASKEITLEAQPDIQPSLKLSGTQRIVFVQDATLSLDVTMKNIESTTLSVKIQKKTGDSYGGDYLTGASVKEGENQFSLTGITESGSYCLSVTGATADGKKVTVPYYFVAE